MSHWDFGSTPSGHRDAATPSGAGGGTGGWAADDFWRPDDGWPPADDRPAQDWPADDPPAEGWPSEGWAAEGSPAQDDGLYEGTAPYPITYERDAADVTGAPHQPWPPAPFPGPEDTAGDRTERWRDQDEPDQDDFYLPGGAPRGRRGHLAPSRRGASQGRSPFAADGPFAAGTRARPRWLIPVGVAALAAVTGASAILLTNGHPSGHASQSGGFTAPTATPTFSASASTAASPPAVSSAPVTLGQAQGVLAGYTTVNNGANAERSDTLLAVAETGSSFAIDTGLYQRQRGLGVAPYPAFGPVQATYYIPRQEPAGEPRWFVVRIANAFSAHPKQVTSIEYLLSTQAKPGGAWRNAIEPYLRPGATAPRIAVGADGLATAVSPTASSVTVAPGQLPAATAAALDGARNGVADPGNLSDLADRRFWRGKLPGATVSDTHAAAAGANGQEFALRTSDGGAIVFYTDAAELTVTARPGTMLHLTVPGFFSPGQALPQAKMSYLEQIAAYDPPAGGGAPRVVADYSGITAAN
jgi:hypothetical protein